MNKHFHVLSITVIILLIGVTNSLLFAQDRIIFNPAIDHFLLNKGNFNPAAYQFENSFGSVFYKSGLGPLSQIKDVYVDALISVNNQNKVGIKVYSEQETSLFKKTKLQGIYSVHVPMNNNIKWSLGTQAGLANISFGGSKATSGGSSWALDLSLASVIRVKKFDLGITFQQMPQSRLSPIGFTFILKRYLDIYMSQQIDLDEHLSFEAGALVNFNNEFFFWKIDTKLNYDKKYGILASLGDTKAYSVGAYLELPFEYNGMFISTSYSNYFRKENLGFNSLSVSVIYNPY